MILDAEIYEDDRGVKRKQKRVQDFLSSLNRLSASLFTAISVAEQQIAILRDLDSLFWEGRKGCLCITCDVSYGWVRETVPLSVSLALLYALRSGKRSYHTGRGFGLGSGLGWPSGVRVQP